MAWDEELKSLPRGRMRGTAAQKEQDSFCCSRIDPLLQTPADPGRKCPDETLELSHGLLR